VDKEILSDLVKELSSKATLHPVIYDAFEKTIKKIFINGTIQEVQFFFDKFKKTDVAEFPLPTLREPDEEKPASTPVIPQKETEPQPIPEDESINIDAQK
jgi:hypothetical protein